MSLLDVIRSAVKVADTVTKPLQADVTFEHYVSSDAYGVQIFDAPTTLKAILEKKQRNVKTPAGQLAISTSQLTFLDVDQLMAATAGNGITVRDRITLSDGSSPVPILNVGGFVDAGTSLPVATEAWLQ